MNLQEIIDAVDAGKTVHWGNTGYEVVNLGPAKGLYISCPSTGGMSPLVRGVTLLYPESEFFLAPESGQPGEAEPAAPVQRVWLLDLRATCLVDAVDAVDAQAAWEKGLEYEYTIDEEGEVSRFEPYFDREPRPEGSPGEMVYSLTADEVRQIALCMERCADDFDPGCDSDTAAYRSALNKLSPTPQAPDPLAGEGEFNDFSASWLGL